MYEIRKIRPNETEEALNLALEVFMQFEAPDYKIEGVETFKKDVIENREFIENCRKGICPIYAAFDGDKIVGIIGMRANKTHINLVFSIGSSHPLIVPLRHGSSIADREQIYFVSGRNLQMVDIMNCFFQEQAVVGTDNKAEFMRIHF